MAKINLLPWREELRKQQQQEFLIAMGAAVVVTCILFVFVYMHIEGIKEYQGTRNKRLETEIAAVDKKIKQINEIEDKKAKLREKIDVIEQLQESRPGVVHLFDELRKRTPMGIYLKSFVQAGENLTIEGFSSDNSKVSEYMYAIEKSEWLALDQLKIIKGQGSQKEGKYSTFIMLAKQVKKKKDEDDAKEGK